MIMIKGDYMNEYIGDFKTLDIVHHTLNLMGLNFLSKEVLRRPNDLDLFIKIIKYRYKQFDEIKEFVEYFL
jgi:hypothetical protein